MVALAAGTLVLLALAVLLGSRLLDDDPPPPASVPDWAARVCGAQNAFVRAIVESRDERDPQSLELEARKQRAAALGRAEIAAAQALERELRAFTPPEAARAYHEALVAQAKETARFVQEQVDAIAKATAAQQIAVANAQARSQQRGAAQAATASAVELPEHVVQALASEPNCSGIGAAPTPSA
ncbi:MAG: hypothetical protein FJ035_04330 [Chloroflexi bacterium]|nr:hypothetical protein [Chloroflexota bacterium]